MPRFFLCFFFLVIASLPSAEHSRAGGKPIPPSPTNYVYVEGVKDADAIGRLDRVLAEQEAATGEQVIVAIFATLDGEDIADYSNRVFRAWKVGQKQRNNGVLLTLFLNDRQMRIEVGYGLEALLTDSRSKRIIENSLIPRMKEGDLWGAIKYGVYDILKTIESPIVQNGRAKEVLWAGAASYKPRAAMTSGRLGAKGVLALLFLFGVILFIARVFFSMVSDATYTSHGWRKTRSWSSGNSGGFGGWGGGGLGGGGSGGGGFSGGGGSSGGGGASGRW